MSGILSADEIVRGLVAQGVPRETAEREAGKLAASRAHAQRPHIAGARAVLMHMGEPVPIPPAEWPIRLRIPWSALVSDNAKFRVGVRRKPGGEPVGSFILTAEYRRARDTIGRLAKDVMAGRPALAQPLSLTARVWVPNNQARDVVNFSKALHDALERVVYSDDKWLYRVTWERAGVDVDAPRAEISIAILPP